MLCLQTINKTLYYAKIEIKNVVAAAVCMLCCAGSRAGQVIAIDKI
jgi:hypothetical protein